MQSIKQTATIFLLALIEVFLIIIIQKTPSIVNYLQNALNLSFHSSIIWMPLSVLITVNFFLIWKELADIPSIKKFIESCTDKFKNTVERLCIQKRGTLCLVIFLLGFLVCLTHMVYVSKCTYVDPDTETYLFQARLFTMGKMYTPSPADPRFIPARHLNYIYGKVYQLFPIGNASILALGEFFHLPWIIPPILSGITLLFVFLIMDCFAFRKAALLTAFLILISPSFWAIGGAWWSENTSRCFLAISLYFFLKSIYHPSLVSAIISGLCWGLAFNTRPATAIVFAATFAIFWLYFLITRGDKKRLFRQGLLIFVVSLWGAALFLWVNHYYTGDIFQTPHNLERKHITLGFGLKAEGINPDLSKVYEAPLKGVAYYYTPLKGLKKLVKNILPTVGMNIAGWGFPENIYGFNFITAILAYIFIIFQLVKFRDNLDLLLATSFVGMLSFLFFLFYDNSIWNSLALGARYYNEPIIIALIPLLAKGIISSGAYFQRLARRFNFNNNSLQFGLVMLLMINWSFFTFTQINYGHKSLFRELRQQVSQMKLENAVVFVKNEQLPLGNLPYEEFGQGEVVYFRLLKTRIPWVLDENDSNKPDEWQEFHAKYFRDRTPFLWDGTRLIELEKGV